MGREHRQLSFKKHTKIWLTTEDFYIMRGGAHDARPVFSFTVGPNHPLKGIIKAKFTFLLHYFVWRKNVKLWRLTGWRHENSLNEYFNFIKVRLISSQGDLEGEYNTKNRFFLRHVNSSYGHGASKILI